MVVPKKFRLALIVSVWSALTEMLRFLFRAKLLILKLSPSASLSLPRTFTTVSTLLITVAESSAATGALLNAVMEMVTRAGADTAPLLSLTVKSN